MSRIKLVEHKVTYWRRRQYWNVVADEFDIRVYQDTSPASYQNINRWHSEICAYMQLRKDTLDKD